MKKRNVWKWFTGAAVAAVLIGLGVPAPVATTVGPTINQNAWDLFDGDDEEAGNEGKQAPEKGLLLEKGGRDRQGQAEEADPVVYLRGEAGEQGRESQLQEAAAAVLIEQVTRSLDKSE